jgi:hypothetical protein
LWIQIGTQRIVLTVLQGDYALHMDKDALKKLKKEYEKKSKEVLKDIDALAKYETKGDADNAELMRRRIRKGAADATALLRQVGTLLPPTPNSRR